MISDYGVNVPPRYRDATIEDKELVESIKKTFENGKGYYFYGGAGTGKTYLLYYLLMTFRKLNLLTAVWNIPEKMAELRSYYADKGEGEDGVRQEIKTKSILLLDDFGAEKQTDWNTEIMYRLINYRYEQMIPTYFASNLSIKELAERNGDRLASRIMEMCEVMKLKGDDKRLTTIKL